MRHLLKPSRFIPLLLTSLLYVNNASADASTLIDEKFEKTGDESWPAGWPQPAECSWESEKGNSFLRIESTEPGKMIMVYREIAIPAGTQSLELSWKTRVTGLVKGENAWFDARIMMEFLNADRQAVSPKAPSPNVSKDTGGWIEKSITFDVPENAAILKFMPTLFRVEAGQYDLDNIVLKAIPEE
ncbi:hypothetical protein P0Y35_07005 [Kiritimatiellaeota bacterium B1221]|nr:hypothetical protein [Kiritimatiellaeota bacterium B1221]